MKNQSSNASLAAAAAGAALRSRPTTPVSVAEVQTKRTMRRTNSNSSMGSVVAGSVQGRPDSKLERRGSSGSMTERTFRDPSPNRGSDAVPSAADAPPVPAIPKKIIAKSQRRASSQEAPPMRVASPPPMTNGRGSSLGPSGGAPASPRRNGQRMSGLSKVQEMPGLERTSSSGSVNFSYPTGNRPTSPYGQRKLTSPTPSSRNQGIVSQQKQNMVYDPNTRSFRPEAELLMYEQQVLDASRAPVKKKRSVAPTAAGSHLAQGTMDGRPRGTAVDGFSTPRVSSPEPKVQTQTKPIASTPAPMSPPNPEQPATATKKKRKKVVISDSDASVTSDADIANDASERPHFNTRAGALLARKPSTIRERNEEGEEEEDEQGKAQGREAALRKLESPSGRSASPLNRSASPVILPKSNAGRGKPTVAASAGGVETRQKARAVSQPPVSQTSPETNGLAPDRPARVQSVSPARKAHFLTAHESTNLSVIHTPPARSISPRKSALKTSPSPRGPSPVGGVPGIKPGHGSGISEASETSTAASELSVPRKKSVRVSFDDNRNEVVGLAAPTLLTDSPIVASPQSKKGWFSSMGRKKKDSSAVDEDDEVMKPRPALPSFGSVREKKTRDTEDRPLVKPAALAEDQDFVPAIQVEELPQSPASPIFTTATGEAIEYPMGQSLDHGIGAVLAQDSVTKNEANVSKLREPLPPQVTSVEGTGYHSDSSSVYENDASDISRSDSVRNGPEDVHVESYRALTSPVPEEPEVGATVAKETNGHVPEFAFTEPTPVAEESKKEWPVMPGGFPSGSDSGNSESVVSTVEHVPTEPKVADMGISEPDPIEHSVTQPIIPYIPEPLYEETEESEQEFSDAAEDLSDMEGDGFMSLNAVVESPMVLPPPAPYARQVEPESPTARTVKERAYKRSQLTRQSSEPDMDEGWEKAQQYWSGLTAEKKRELELAARKNGDLSSSEEDSGEETEKEIEKFVAPVAVAAVPVLKPALKKTAPAAAIELEPQRVSPERQYQIKPGQKAGVDGHAVPTMRSSMRQAPANTSDDVHMRRSMRDSGSNRSSRDGKGGSLRSSMRNSMRDSQSSDASYAATYVEPKGALQKKNRPMSFPAQETEDPAEKHAREVQKHVRALSAASASAAAKRNSEVSSVPPSLRRRGSDASDSSFKRSRGNKDGSSMRGSMRNPATNRPARPLSPEPVKSSRFSIRSLSPTGSTFRRPFSGGGGANSAPPISMSTGRTTMRNRGYSNESNTPTLRSTTGTERAKSPLRSFGGFGGRKAAAAPVAAPKAAKVARSSRFADSSDEEDSSPNDRRGGFKSRFGDSSDEDEPIAAPRQRMTTMRASAPAAAQTQIRGIPRPAGVMDGDSSDLQDSDEEKPIRSTSNSKKASASPAGAVSHEGSALANGSLRRSGSGRDAMGSRPAAINPNLPSSPSTDRPGHKRRPSFMSSILGRKKDKSSGVQKSTIESPARRDTPLERSGSELAAIRQNSPNRPKLQKRTTGSYVQGSSTVIPTTNGNSNGHARPEILRMGSNWPLGKDEESGLGALNDSEGRPFTSDGTERVGMLNGAGQRPDLGNRRATDLSQVGSTRSPAGKKKKKFGMLRRAFGLDH